MRLPRLCVFDLDGVLFRGETVIPEAPRCIERLRSAGVAVAFLTNNSSQPRTVYVAKLTRLGMPCTEEEIVTSASISAWYLREETVGRGATVFAVGGPGIRDEMERVGISVRSTVDPVERDHECDHVVVGLDREFRYETLLRAQQCILRGARFIATNRDTQYPTETGVIPGGGSIVAAVAAASETEPTTVGKPERHGLDLLMARHALGPADVVMVGDRPDTDILCANRCGVASVLVLTGVTDREQAECAPTEMRPGRIVDTLDELWPDARTA
ncbi:MAG: HAD-IIA family hydrolase [Armatimonadota bacterium]